MGNILKYKLFESLYDEFTLDFKDHGFEIQELGKKIKGKYKGKFIISDLNLWYIELCDRLDSEYEVISSKSSFNTVSGAASFEVEFMDKKSGFFSVFVNDKEFKLYPDVMYMSLYNYSFSLFIDGRDESGVKSRLHTFTKSDGESNYIVFTLGPKRSKVHIKPSELENFIKLIKDLKIGYFGVSREMSDSDKSKLDDILYTTTKYRISLTDAINNLGDWNREESAYIINLDKNS